MFSKDAIENWRNSPITQHFHSQLLELKQACLESALSVPIGSRDSYIDRAHGVILAIGKLETIFGGTDGDST